MIEMLGDLITYIVILIFFSALLEMIIPHGEFRRYLRLFIGILLILTLLTPIQKIVQVVPNWELPAFNGFQEEEIKKEEISLQGEEIYEKKINMALDSYRSKIFQMIDEELIANHDLKLYYLELSLQQDPTEEDFGALKEIKAVTMPPGLMNEEDVEAERKNALENESIVETVSIEIDVLNGSADETGKEVPQQKEDIWEKNDIGTQCEKTGEKIEEHIASLLQVPVNEVRVKALQKD